MHWTPQAFNLARDKAGRSRAARMAMIAITTKSSIRVNPLWLGDRMAGSRFRRILKATLGRNECRVKHKSCPIAPHESNCPERDEGQIGHGRCEGNAFADNEGAGKIFQSKAVNAGSE